MIKYISIIISFLLITSCTLNKKGRIGGDGGYDFSDIKDYDTTGKSHKDLPDDVKENYKFTEYLDKIKINRSNLLVGSNNYNNYPTEKIIIIEKQNTKVIKNTSNLSEGRIVYRIPNIMKVRSTYKVIVRISKSKGIVSIYDSLQGTVITSTLHVTETMEVKLIDLSPKDNKAFDIEDDNSGSVQIVENGDTYTEWSWGVTPIHVGSSKLEIVVSIIRNGNKKDIVYEDIVDVEMDAKEQIIFFLEEYWKWIITTFISPFIVWWWKNRKKSKSEKTEENGEGKTV